MNKKLKDFSDLLDTIASTADKKKFLWKEIYENAIVDRNNAYMLFTNLYNSMGSASTEHSTFGVLLSKYIERMNKSNDQLLKLVELISKEQEKSEKINMDDMFDAIGN